VPEKSPGGRRHRPPTDDELRTLWREASTSMSPQNVRVLKLAVLTGKRISEIVETKQAEVLLDGDPHWLIPADRTGNKGRIDQIVPLPRWAAVLFAEAAAAHPRSVYMFPARTSKDVPITRHTPSQDFTEFRRKIGLGDDARFHDTRALLINQLSRLKVPREYRSHLLHHTGDMKSTLADNVYSTYDFLDEKRRALRLWQIRLKEILRGGRLRPLRW
jgi:integrase